MNKPKISVLLPAYNAELHIREAVESILQQSFKDFELLIFNDGSTDKTHEIICSFTDARIFYKKYDSNIGYVHLLNEGLELARGGYIARMDADDIADIYRLEKQYKYLEENKDISICGTWFQNFGSCNEIVKQPVSVDEVNYALFYGTPIGHPTVLMRKKDLDMYNLRYDPSYLFAEDYELFERASCKLKIANIPEVLLQYRKHDSQVTNRKWKLQYYLTGKIQARRFSRAFKEYSSLDEEWMNRFFTCASLLNEDWLASVDRYKQKLIEENSYTCKYKHETFVTAVNNNFAVAKNKNIHNYYFNTYYASSIYNMKLLKSFILERYKPYKYLGAKLTLYFIVKCIINYKK